MGNSSKPDPITLIVPQKIEKNDASSSAPTSSGNIPTSTRMTVVVMLITHGFINSLLLGPWNPIRCVYWNRHHCTVDEEWVLNWFAFGTFHVSLLLSFLAYQVNGKIVFEKRLSDLCTGIIVSHLTAGVYMIDLLNKPMATIQLFIYFSLLLMGSYTSATEASSATSTMMTVSISELRSSSFDSRQKLPISAISLVLLFLLSFARVIDMTLGSGQDTYMGDSSTMLYKSISDAATTQMMWCTLILGYSVLYFTKVEQQKSILFGHIFALFLAQCLLTGKQGEQIERTQTRVGVIVTLFAIIIGILGIV